MRAGMPALSAAISARASCDSLNIGSPATSTSSWSRLAANDLVATRPGGTAGCAAARRARSRLRRRAGCQRTRSPTTQSLFLPRGWQMQALALGRLDDEVAAVAGHHEAQVERGELAASSRSRDGRASASTLAAQMKSLIEMPPTEWVLKRTRAAVVADRQVGVVVLGVRDPGQRVHEGHRVVVVGESVASSRSRRRPATSRAPARRWRSMSASLIALAAVERLAAQVQQVGAHAAMAPWRLACSAASRSPAGGCE